MNIENTRIIYKPSHKINVHLSASFACWSCKYFSTL